MKKLVKALKKILKDSVEMCQELFKVMIPIIILVKILEEIGAVHLLAKALAPLMGLVGLPGEMGIVLATSMLSNLYAALVVFFNLSADCPLSVAQVTVLCAMMLVAHALLLESRILQKAGTRFLTILIFRFTGAFGLGASLFWFYRLTGLVQEPNKLIWQPAKQDNSLWQWGYDQVKSLIIIWIVIVILLGLMELFKKLKITDFISWVLRPILAPLGIGHEAINITTVGMVLGVTCGAGLIIKEAKLGHIGKKDLFFSLALMGICHSLIEDTLLMMAIGADWSGIIVGRIIFSLVFVFILEKVVKYMPDRFFQQYCAA